MAGILTRFSFATVTRKQMKNSFNNENIVKSNAFWLSVWKKLCSDKAISKEIENYESRRKLKTNLVKPRRRRFVSSKVIRTQNEQFLELFSRTLKFFARLICENIIVYCFDLRVLVFSWPNAQSHLQGLNKLLLYLMHALCFCIIKIVFFYVYYQFFHVYYQYVITWFLLCNLE